MNKTAVSWLFTQLDQIKFLPRGEWVKARENILKEAKEMERKQITEAWNDGNLLGRNGHVLLPYDNGNGYYNENFN